MKHATTTEPEVEVLDTPPPQPEPAPPKPEPENNPLAKFDGDTLRGIGTSAVAPMGTAVFLPRNMGEAMEFAKLMAASNVVPPHLRGQRGDCLAIILQSMRWNADPFAVANKTYFIKERMAYEAQLVNAVVNTSSVLQGRLQVSWQGTVGKPGFQCTVRGKIKGDDDVHELIQESDTITVKNSPLWKQSERVQLAYYTTRAWGRLYTPEVLLGIYTPDEIEDPRVVEPPGTQTVIPPRPTRAAAEAQAKELRDAEARAAGRIPSDDEAAGDVEEEVVDHDPKTGEITEPGPSEEKPRTEPTPETEPLEAYQGTANMLIAKVQATAKKTLLDAFQKDYEQELALLADKAAPLRAEVQKVIDARYAHFRK